ncbi:hypothetical protein MMC17_002791 [Xylographa soralifera]|nr:hypothetical protein [Xylographa soralifera]
MDRPTWFDIGTRLQQGRYKILAIQSANQEDYPVYQLKQRTYIAQDTQANPSQCVSLRVLPPEAVTSTAITQELKLLTSLNRAAGLHQHVLAPRETFLHTTQAGENLCLVYEDLFGPDLWYMSEVVGPESSLLPAAMIWKIAKQALESLAFLHRNGICHGNISLSSWVLTYPNVDTLDVDQVLTFYDQPNEVGGIQSLNETCTDAENKPYNLDGFRLKVQDLAKAVREGDSRDAISYIQPCYCPPPELLYDNHVSTATDIWYLATLLADLAAGTPEFAPRLLGGEQKSATDRLLNVQHLLGDLPEPYLTRLARDQDDPPANYSEQNLLAAIRAGPLTDEVQRFADEELELMVDLLKGMLRYDPRQRYTAEQALQHKFLEMQRPGES